MIRRWLTGRLAVSVVVLTAATVLPAGPASAVTTPVTVVTEFPLAAGKPEQIALAPDGTVWISHWDDNAISRISAQGTPTGPPLAVPGGPGGIVVAPDGTVYSAQGGLEGNTIARIAPDGPADPAWASVPSPGGPTDLAVDVAGNLYTANFSSRTVSKVSPDGAVDGAWATVSTRPYRIAVHPVAGVLMGSYNGTVTRIDADGVPTVVRGPTGIFTSGVTYAPDGTGYVADFYGTIARISADGTLTATWATVGGVLGGIAVDGDGDVYVSRYDNDTIVKIDADGTVTPWLTVSAGFLPGDLAVSPDGSRLWAASLARGAIARVTVTSPPGAVGDLTGTGQDKALAVSFEAPTSNGGSAVTGYEVSTDGGATWAPLSTTTVGSRLTATLTTGSDGAPLVNGTRYDVVIRAVNSVGPGAEATVSASPVAPSAPPAPPVTAPGPPTDVTVVPGDRQATVSWGAPADDGGAAISGYTVVATPESATTAEPIAALAGGAVRVTRAATAGVRLALAASPGMRLAADTAAVAPEPRTCTTTRTTCTVTGLVNGASYRFAVTATNRAGTSAPAAFLAAVVPAGPAGPPASAVPPTELPVPTDAPATTGPTATTEAPAPIAAPTAVAAPTSAAPTSTAATGAGGTGAPGSAAGLAYTGFAAVPALALASLLLAGGGLALAVGRRRAATPTRD